MALINLRNALMTGRRLPYDAEVEYLESTGTQWIDTGISSQNDLVYDFDVYEDSRNNQRRFFGFKEGRDWTTPGMNDANWGDNWYYVDFANAENRVYFTRPIKEYNLYHFDFSDGAAEFYFNSSKIWSSSLSGTYEGTRHVLVFMMDVPWLNQTNNRGIGRITFFQVRKHGTLLIDLIPVRFTNELGQTEGAMFDRANPTVGMDPDGSARDDGLYRNRGTGAFLYGNDLKYPIPAE